MAFPLDEIHRRASNESLLTVDSDGNIVNRERPNLEAAPHTADGEPSFGKQALHHDIENKSASTKIAPRALSYHYSGAFLTLAYVVAEIIIWALACVLSYKPIQFATYDDATARYQRSQFVGNDRWRQLVKTANSILAALSVPVTSMICARAVVVYCQTPSVKVQKPLSLRQMLSLVDKGWTDPPVLINIFRRGNPHKTGSCPLYLAALLCGLGVMIPALQGYYLDTVQVNVSIGDGVFDDLAPGRELTPSGLTSVATSKDVILAIIEDTTASSGDFSYLWTPHTNASSMPPLYDIIGAISSIAWFASAVPTSTDTGVLRVYSLGMGSSVNCAPISASDFPSKCPGSDPFSSNYSNIDQTRSAISGNTSQSRADPFAFRICAPGDISSSPWQSTLDKQQISEDLYLDYQNYSTAAGAINYTYHCIAESTMGYFELPNQWNGLISGDILGTAPNVDEISAQGGLGGKLTSHPTSKRTVQSDSANVPPNHVVPGPLLTSVLAMFGNGTFFNTLTSVNSTDPELTAICEQLRVPFGDNIDDILLSSPYTTEQCSDEQDASAFDLYLSNWLKNWNETLYLSLALTAGTYYSARETLNPEFFPEPTVNTDGAMDHSRFLYSSPGIAIQKFSIAKAPVIAISLLILVQVVGLLLFAAYSISQPTWTASLDGFATLRIGAALANRLPLVSSLQAKDVAFLEEKRGWIGDDGDAADSLPTLTVGGLGRPRQHTLYRCVNSESNFSP